MLEIKKIRTFSVETYTFKNQFRTFTVIYTHMLAVYRVNQKFVTTLKNHKKGINYDKEVRFARKGSQESLIFLAARKK
jgi:hypothetical protein